MAMEGRANKRRKVAVPSAHAKAVKAQEAYLDNASQWTIEEDYESRPRKSKNKKDSNRLPIRTLDGRIEQPEADPRAQLAVSEDEQDAAEDSGFESEGPSEPQIAKPLSKAEEREQVLKAKEELAKIGTQLNEKPEEFPGAFKNLAAIGETSIPAIQKLCLVTQLAIYRDVIPGYQIRPQGDGPPGEKLSKDVRSVQTYEQALVSGYQVYLQKLTKLAKGSGTNEAQILADVAITCACTLLNSVPHFNFRNELLKILVGKLSSRKVSDSFRKCVRAFETLFREDDEGRPTMEAVSLISRMMRAKDFNISETVLNLFLHLRLLSEYSGKASKDGIDEADQPRIKPSKKNREYRSKRERKSMKEEKELAKQMAQADATVSHEERDRMQSETLKLVFATYFRILKLRSPQLMGAVLEGLTKYTHLINRDFFGDLLEALKDLVRYSELEAAADDGDDDDGEDDDENQDEDDDDGDDLDSFTRNTTREALLCNVTAFSLLAGQDAHNARAELNLDLSFFTTHLFRSLLPMSLDTTIELGGSALDASQSKTTIEHKAVPKVAANKVNYQTLTVLLVRCLSATLLPQYNIRSVPPLRLASFTKQLMTASLQMPEKSCQALLALLHDVAHSHGKKVSALWNTEERKGDGHFNALSDSVEGSNPFATNIWEGEMLRRHYCPKVREGVKFLEKSIASAQ